MSIPYAGAPMVSQPFDGDGSFATDPHAQGAAEPDVGPLRVIAVEPTQAGCDSASSEKYVGDTSDATPIGDGSSVLIMM